MNNEVAGTLVITREEADTATTREARNALLDRKLFNLRQSLIVATFDAFGWAYAENTTPMK